MSLKHSKEKEKLEIASYDPFNYVLNTFLENVSCIAVYGGQKALRCNTNILICVPKMNEGLTGLEPREGE